MKKFIDRENLSQKAIEVCDRFRYSAKEKILYDDIDFEPEGLVLITGKSGSGKSTVLKELAGKKLAVVPILRAGLGMVSGILALVPTAKVGHIGMYRDEETHEPHEYYCKLPSPIEERLIIVTDPMLATGGSAVDAIDQIKKHGGKKIKFMCIIAAPEGLEKLHKAHPDVQIYVGHLDRQLNENAYICPGLGDAGDRIFGTK